MEVDVFPTLSRVQIAQSRLQYFGRAAVEAAWEQMVERGFAAELDACHTGTSKVEPRKRRRSSHLKQKASPDDLRFRTHLKRYGQESFDESKHPRAPAGRPQGGQFIRRGDAIPTVRNVDQPTSTPIKRAAPLPRLIPESTPSASRMDSEWQWTGVFWNVDGRPWELSPEDIRNWKAITERDWWTEGWNALAPVFWMSIPEFEAEIKRKARSYRDRMLLVEGSPNPIDVFKRRNERSQAALLADAEELFKTIDNATSMAGIAKAPLKAGIKAIARTAKGAAKAVSKTGATSAIKSQLPHISADLQAILEKDGISLENIRVGLENGNADDLRWLRMAIEEAIERQKLGVVSPRSAVIRKAPDAGHHIFLDTHRKWFKKRYNIDVDEFLVDLDNVTHDALQAGKKPLKDNTGWWGHELMDTIRRAEERLGPGKKLTRDEVLDIGRKLLKQFKLDHLPIRPKKPKPRK